MKRRVTIAIAAVLTACGAVATTSDNAAESAPQKSSKAKKQPSAGFPRFEEGGMAGCFDPKLSGYARAAAERIGGVPCKTPSGAEQSGDDPWVGRWRGSGEMTIIATGSNRYAVSIETGAPGCGGEIKGAASASAGRLTLSVPPPQPGYRQCTMTFDRKGTSIQATENGDCYLFYGGACSFGGDYARRSSVRSTAAAPTRSAGGASASWIAGAWAASRVNCALNGPTFENDGRYYNVSESGRWSLAGNTLTLVATHESDGESDYPLRPPRRTSVRVSPLPDGRMSWRVGNRPAVVMVRCPVN